MNLKTLVLKVIKELKKFWKAIEKTFWTEKIKNELSVFTHLNLDEKILLYKLAKQMHKNAICVEIGSYLGASSNIISKGLSKKAKLYCVDTWGNHKMIYEGDSSDDKNLVEKDTLNEFRNNTKKYKSKIIELRGWSYDKIEDLKKLENRIDFLFIDGDHDYIGVKKDWDEFSKLLGPGGIVVFHDTGWADGVKKVISEDVNKNCILINYLPNMQVFKMK